LILFVFVMVVGLTLEYFIGNTAYWIVGIFLIAQNFSLFVGEQAVGDFATPSFVERYHQGRGR